VKSRSILVRVLDSIPAPLLDRAIEGVGLRGRTLRAELALDAPHPTLLVFLRHFG
jgi:hypothetical protein